MEDKLNQNNLDVLNTMGVEPEPQEKGYISYKDNHGEEKLKDFFNKTNRKNYPSDGFNDFSDELNGFVKQNLIDRGYNPDEIGVDEACNMLDEDDDDWDAFWWAKYKQFHK